MTVSVILPTRNESENISRIVGEIKKVSPDYNVIVVDDSEDNHLTRMLALASGANVISGQHKGLGQAIIDGIKASDSDIVVVCDADGSHQTKFIPVMVKTLTEFGYDMTIGSRYVSGGSINGWTTKRRLVSGVASAIAYPLTGLRDNTSGFFGFKRSILDGANLQPTSWKIMLEVLVKAKPKKVIETPIQFEDRVAGKSKFTLKEAFAYLKHLCLLSLYKYRILNFMLVGFLGYIINMGLYYPLTLVFQNEVTFLGQHFYLPPFVLSSLVAITSNYFMNKHWTFSEQREANLGYLRYLSMALITLLFDMVLLFVLVDYASLPPVLAAAVAILIVFVARFAIASKYIWGKSKHT